MRGLAGIDAVDGVRSLLGWWALAGVDEALEDSPRGWPRMGEAAANVPAVAEGSGPGWPTDLQGFHAWLAEDSGLPEASWSTPAGRVAPRGRAAASLMVISDMPDAADVEAGSLFAGEAGKLLDNMLRAIGHSRSDAYLASLAVARPAGGTIPADVLPALAVRMRHHVSLVGPKKVLILGDKTSRALPTTSGAAGGQGLRPFNHDGGTVDAVATFHPRFLLRQAAAKAQAWAALRTLI